ncbi:protein translocase subunit SecD [candidate division KSB1 bacterium]|nr:protein translocase subunit SecD [candidate division KSB1 bacterium]
MQRKQIFKLAFVLILLGLAVYSLYPTLQFGQLQNREQELLTKVSNLTGISHGEIQAAINQGKLLAQIRQQTSGEDSIQALKTSTHLIQLNDKLTVLQERAIRRGLDLQGGTYLVYEVDLPKLMRDISKNPDERLDDIISQTQEQLENEGGDFFVHFQQVFNQRNIRLNRYYGRKGQADDDIIQELKNEALDTVDRTVERLRNRIDQFGVSEPNITKQGSRRIIIELAGVTNIQRAKDIIGKTAVLEFKLVRDPEIVWSILNDIDRVVRAEMRGEEFEEAVMDTQSIADGEQASEEEIDVSELFGEDETQVVQEDTSVLVDQKTFKEKPFTSLLRGVSGRYSEMISVPVQNVRAVQRWLSHPEVQQAIPSDSEFLFGIDSYAYGENEYVSLYLVKSEAELTGNVLKNAQVDISSGAQSFNAGAAVVNMELNSEGTKTFARVTGMNVGKKLAIVLDNRVKSAPNIKSKIPNGNAVIENIGEMEEAQDLALVLRAGALPAPVHIITENTVGPSLGQDSIQKGSLSAVVGLLVVILFMVIYYRAAGLVADIALIMNIIFVLAVMASFHATLTLPGIAGIILTVGMAVDANVLIFERIREELKMGRTIRSSIDNGYDRAFSTILDANITTLITAVVLYQFGTGPIKGFALTLSIGIVASMFTAIVVTRLVFDIVTSKYAIKKLSI